MVSAKKTMPTSCRTRKVISVVVQGGRAPGQGEDRHQIEKNEGRETEHDPGRDRAQMMAKYGEDGHAHLLGPRLGGGEHRGLGDTQPDVKPQEDEHCAREEGKPPSEGEELGVGQCF